MDPDIPTPTHTLGTTYTLERELGGNESSRVFLAEESGSLDPLNLIIRVPRLNTSSMNESRQARGSDSGSSHMKRAGIQPKSSWAGDGRRFRAGDA